MTKHWYRVDVEEGSKSRTICGHCEHDPDQLARTLSAGGFLRLDGLVYKDNQQRFRSYSE